MNNYKLNFGFGFILTLLFMNMSMAQNDEAAKSTLDQVSATMRGYKNISMDFDYVLDNKAEDVKQEMSGDLLLEGEKYLVNLFGSTQIFDGSKN